ncbi:MAG: hypothetical protein ACXABY_12730 [Candidatus Thorarchaeota archaeon]|jgi:hypothetical protein
MNRNEYIEAVLDVTGGESWKAVQEGLKADIRNVEVQELEADLEDVKELRGFRRALIYVHDMRELAKLEKANAV